MKKDKWIRALLVLPVLPFLLLSGCATPGQTPPGCSYQGNQLTIILEENPSTGYSWHYEVDQQGILELVKDEYRASEDMSKVGAPGSHSWIFNGLGRGEVVLMYRYYRSWEDPGTAVESRVFQITLDAQGKIKNVKEVLPSSNSSK